MTDGGHLLIMVPRIDVVMPACDKQAASALFSTEKQAAGTHCSGPERVSFRSPLDRRNSQGVYLPTRVVRPKQPTKQSN